MKALGDLLRARQGKRKRSRLTIFFNYVVVAAVTLVLGAIFVNVVRDEQSSAIAAATLGVLVGFMGCLWTAFIFRVVANRGSRGESAAYLQMQTPQELWGDDDGLRIAIAGIVLNYPWSCFVDHVRTASHLFLFISDAEGLVVPRPAVTGTPLEALINERMALRRPSSRGN